jgi:hypothetical protein
MAIFDNLFIFESDDTRQDRTATTASPSASRIDAYLRFPGSFRRSDRKTIPRSPGYKKNRKRTHAYFNFVMR